MRAICNGAVVAESDDTIVIEGNHYFPADSVRTEHLTPSAHTTVCPWKGQASYYDVVVDGDVSSNAAWVYTEPKEAAAAIQGRVAFWRGVEVVPD